jgi:hypothetical protein
MLPTQTDTRLAASAVVFSVILLVCGLLPPMVPATLASTASQLRRYPYVTDVVGSYATINWGTDRSATSGQVRYGTVASGSCATSSASAVKTAITVNGVAEYQWKAQLTLSPNARYCYRVYLAAMDLLGTDPSPSFWTQLPAGSTVSYSFAVIGDWGAANSGGANADQANVMTQIAASGARFALTIGDNGYPSGSQANYGDLQQVGTNLSGIFGRPFWAKVGASIPIFPAIGNHGFSRADTYHPHLLNWPQDRAVATSGGRYVKETYCCVDGTSTGSYPSAWYAFDAGSVRFYVLEASWTEANVGSASVYQVDRDYHWTANSAEYTWLANDLAKHPSGLKIAVFHYPMYSDNSTENSDAYLQGKTGLEGLLTTYGVRLAFTGHAHIYERNVASSLGLVTYVTGGGGAKLEPIGAKGCSSFDAYGIGWSYSANGGLGAGSACGSASKPTSIQRVFHFLKVTVVGSRVSVTPTDEMGRTFDVHTY